MEQNTQCKAEAANISKRIELVEASKQKLLGEKLEAFSFQELCDLEAKVEQSLRNIRGQKHQLLSKQIAQLEEKERNLTKENNELREKCKTDATRTEVLLSDKEHANNPQLANDLQTKEAENEVETELYIGWPVRRLTD